MNSRYDGRREFPSKIQVGYVAMSRSIRIRLQVVLPFLLLLCSAPLLAANVSTPQALDLDTVEDFTVYRAAISEQLQHSDTYVEITPDNRSRALTLMAEMEAIIGRSGSIAAMPPIPRVDVFNRQEELNQILSNAAEDSRVICRRERPTGSKMPVNNCLTLAERRKTREGGKQYLREIIPSQELPKTR